MVDYEKLEKCKIKGKKLICPDDDEDEDWEEEEESKRCTTLIDPKTKQRVEICQKGKKIKSARLITEFKKED